MKALATIGILLALVTFLPSPAAAQQTSMVVVQLESPQDALRDGESLTFSGIVTFTADYTAFLGLMGIPVSYTVTATPEWASVIVSPASDVFPLPSTPGLSPSYTVARQITITVSAAEGLTEDATAAIEIAATTSPTMLGKAATGKGTALVTYDAPEPPCPEHSFTDAQLALYAEQAAELLAAEAAREEPESEVTTQSTGAARLSVPWLAVGGFALVGAGIGLALRRRLAP